MAASLLWPAVLDHLRLDSTDPDKLVEFYREALRMTPTPAGDGATLMSGPDRRLLLGRGERNSHPFSAWRLAHEDQVVRFRAFVQGNGLEPLPSPTPLFAPGAFAVRDPDGRLAVFGVPRDAGDTPRRERPAARLEHVVVASPQLEPMRAFYVEKLGFLVSDVVYDSPEDAPLGNPHVYFFRAEHEHHSFAVFRGSTARSDHHCYGTAEWNDIRDWLDHLGELDVAPWWGPGRHGPGHNLFFMIRDPDGNNIELSAEIEHLTRIDPPRHWPNSRHMYNLWGVGWNRE